MITQKRARESHRQQRKLKMTDLSFRQWARKTFSFSEAHYSHKLSRILLSATR